MLFRSNELVRLVKQAAVEAVRAGAPMAVCYGTVLSTTPLKIQVDQKLILTEVQLILTKLVRDLKVEVYMDHETESVSHEHTVTGAAEVGEHTHPVAGTTTVEGTIEPHGHAVTAATESVFHGHSVAGIAQAVSHSHDIRGWKKLTLRWGLTVGERVILLRCDGGQKYVVLDRWGARE